MNDTYRSLLSVGITLAMSITSQTSVAVDTNIVGKSSVTNNVVKMNTAPANAPSLSDTNMVYGLYRYFTKSSVEELIRQEDDLAFFHVRWMDALMNSVDFDSTVTEGGGTFGIDTAMMRTVRIRKGLCLGPYYISKYPLTSAGMNRDVTDIGFMLRFDLW